MEFERALFRIHQRTLLSAPVKNVRVQAERWLPWVLLCLSILLFILHTQYIGKAECLPTTLKSLGYWNATSSRVELPLDVLLKLYVVDEPDVLHSSAEDFVDMKWSMKSPAASSGADPPSSARSNVTHVGLVHAEGGFSVQQESSSNISSAPHLKEHEYYLDAKKVLLMYKFAEDREILTMSQSLFESHNFKVLNVTVSDRCLAPSWFMREMLLLFDAMDCILLNELAYSLRSRGYMDRFDGEQKIESWAWSQEQVEATLPNPGRTLMTSVARKAGILFKSALTFLLISSMTGLFIRVAVNGSAVIMFPMAIFAQSFHTGGLNVLGLMRSFPWIGVHVEVLRRAGRSFTALFRSHLIFFLLLSFAYLSCNLAWRFIFYRQSTPEGFEEGVFSFCSMLELFNLIFVRSGPSAAVFPKVVFASLVYLHFYVFCSLYPFHGLAYSITTGVCAYVAVYCLNHFEEPALHADPFAFTTPTAAHPRALYMPQLSPSWSLEAAPLWTMFYLPEPPEAFPREAMHQISNEEYMMP
mmetsp:Transcript_15018/g.33740  ORF Transcript_15018/g.33740 Transcript_15018/m.33740 type:complete len:527 (-) Transcript_15018:13-1593(-)